MFPEPYIELQRMFQRQAFEQGLRFEEVSKTMAVVVVWLMPYFRDSEIREIFNASMKAARMMYEQVFPDNTWPPAETWRPAFDAGDPMSAPDSLTITEEMLEHSIKAWNKTMEKDLNALDQPA